MIVEGVGCPSELVLAETPEMRLIAFRMTLGRLAVRSAWCYAAGMGDLMLPLSKWPSSWLSSGAQGRLAAGAGDRG